ncbi:Gfo/Idh/MocA family protein [Blastochloris viridis]|uniref:Putative oxidoreductase n=1 Tax=Blastochloris viridis TaxID=1079 RepID=A0A0H5B8Q0_BLAVI|nr:Gfo/Idh/MocA family oxidoreductase [Blastochloris viridis]ALK08142.1 Putative UDP-kanosamine synthase oxidoreductase subunit [Blastochloris viridis]BAR98592.1 putative oxidoreductase [Blastochloris viridis]CUU44064.1 putative oxidoreductase ycjS [Blastochloris viridis]
MDHPTGLAAKFVIVGDGWVARTCYLPALRRLGAAEPVVIDSAPEHGGAAAVQRALAMARGRRDLLAIVATPNASHWPLAAAFLEAGARVLVEKPLSLPGEVDRAAPGLDSDALSRLWVSAPYRFRPDVVRLMAAVAAGRIGAVREVRAAWRRRAGIPRPGSWYTSRRWAGGGVLVDLGPHLLDVALALTDWPEVAVTASSFATAADWRISASGWMPDGGRDELPCDVEVAARLELSDAAGRRYEVEVAWASDVEEDVTTIEVVGSHGRLELVTLFGFAPGRTVGRLAGAVTAEIALDRDPATDFARLIAAVERGEAATGHQGLQVMAVIAAAYRAGGATTAVPR